MDHGSRTRKDRGNIFVRQPKDVKIEALQSELCGSDFNKNHFINPLSFSGYEFV